MSESTYDVHPPKARWTHVALRVRDIDATIGWYTEFTPLELLDRREDDDGYGAWLGMSDAVEQPFILVVAQFFEHRDPFRDAPRATLAPFAHLGMELPRREDVDEMAAKGEAARQARLVAEANDELEELKKKVKSLEATIATLKGGALAKAEPEKKKRGRPAKAKAA